MVANIYLQICLHAKLVKYVKKLYTWSYGSIRGVINADFARCVKFLYTGKFFYTLMYAGGNIGDIDGSSGIFDWDKV